jgi:hypothetical protein
MLSLCTNPQSQRRWRALALVAVCGGLLGQAAPADAQWAPAVTLDVREGSARLAFSPSGEAAALISPIEAGLELWVGASGGQLGRARTVSSMAGGANDALAAFGRHGLAVIGGDPRPWVALGTFAHPPQHRRHLLTGAAAGGAVAATGGGGLAVLERTCAVAPGGSLLADCARSRVYLLVKPAGRGWRAPVLLASGRIDGPIALAANTKGGWLATWAQRHGKTRALMTASGGAGRPASRPRELGDAPAPLVAISASLANDRSALVSWVSEGGSQCVPSTPATFAAALAGPRGTFHPQRRLDRWDDEECGAGLPSPGVASAISDHARGLLAWTGMDRQSAFFAQVATTTATSIGAGHRLSPPGRDGRLAGLAVSPSGKAVVSWTENDQGQNPTEGQTLKTSLRLSQAGAFSTPETITDNVVPIESAIAFDPLHDEPFALWSTRSGSMATSTHSG